VRYKGKETIMMRDDGDGARTSIDVVIVRPSQFVSKMWYDGKWADGSHAAPDCMSSNGITPDAGIAKKQAVTCSSCKRNEWGSRITPQGKKGKDCQDKKRLAVVPAKDLRNELYGGAMLLAVPAASLSAAAEYTEKLAAGGLNVHDVITRISFDPSQSYPKFVFTFVDFLKPEEIETIKGMRGSHHVARLLQEGEGNLPPLSAVANPVSSVVQETVPVVAVAAPPLDPTPPPDKSSTELEDELDRKLAELMK
jgi:hypothetical protein